MTIPFYESEPPKRKWKYRATPQYRELEPMGYRATPQYRELPRMVEPDAKKKKRKYKVPGAE